MRRGEAKTKGENNRGEKFKRGISKSALDRWNRTAWAGYLRQSWRGAGESGEAVGGGGGAHVCALRLP